MYTHVHGNRIECKEDGRSTIEYSVSLAFYCHRFESFGPFFSWLLLQMFIIITRGTITLLRADPLLPPSLKKMKEVEAHLKARCDWFLS